MVYIAHHAQLITLTNIVTILGYYLYENQYDNENSSENTTTTRATNDTTNEMNLFAVPYHTTFIGFGVLSFAFVCQNPSFIIDGSLQT